MIRRLSFLFLVSLLAGCHPPDPVIATVADKPIYAQDLLKVINSIPRNTPVREVAVSPAGRRLYLDQIINVRILNQAALDAGFTGPAAQSELFDSLRRTAHAQPDSVLSSFYESHLEILNKGLKLTGTTNYYPYLSPDQKEMVVQAYAAMQYPQWMNDQRNKQHVVINETQLQALSLNR